MSSYNADDLISRETLRAEIRSMIKESENFGNRTYAHGYIMALCAIQGFIADPPYVPLPICHGDCGAPTPEEARKRLLPNLRVMDKEE